MTNFVLGTIFGIIVGTIGFGGVATLADKGVNATKEIVQEVTKN